MPLSVFQLLFKANLLFKDCPVYSSTFQTYAGRSKAYHLSVITNSLQGVSKEVPEGFSYFLIKHCHIFW